MDTRTFDRFRDFIYQKSGITLSSGKEALVSARMGKRMRILGLPSHKDYLEYVLADNSGEELVHMLDAISTNVTSFYREPRHFEFLARAVQKWHRAGQRRFRIWCAAASTGEEPYTIAITMLDALGTADVDIRILATDISTRVLQHCVEGVYDEERVEPVPKALRSKYFDRVRRDGETVYAARAELKRLLVFRRLNLSQPPFPMQGPLDIVFCRNVMIYFDNKVRMALLTEVSRVLRPSGYLMVGHAESLTGMMGSFRTVQPSVYVRG